mgnify:CR=1 FL=1
MKEHERQETRSLLVPLTHDEYLDRARKLAAIDDELVVLETERKAALDGFKNRKGEVLTRKLALNSAVRTGEEERDIDCEWQENFSQKCWQLVRLDTSEVVDTIAMTVDELQQKIPGTEDAGAGKKKRASRKKRSSRDDADEADE